MPTAEIGVQAAGSTKALPRREWESPPCLTRETGWRQSAPRRLLHPRRQHNSKATSSAQPRGRGPKQVHVQDRLYHDVRERVLQHVPEGRLT